MRKQFTVNQINDEQSKILYTLGIENSIHPPKMSSQPNQFDIRLDIPDNFWSEPSIIDVIKLDDNSIEVVYTQYCSHLGDATFHTALRRVYKIIYSFVDNKWIESPKLYGDLNKDDVTSIEYYDFYGYKNFRIGSTIYSTINKRKMIVQDIIDGKGILCTWTDNNIEHSEIISIPVMYYTTN